MKKHLSFLILLLLGCIGVKGAGPSGTLPVIYINIENGAEVVTKEPYLNAVYWLDPKGVEGIEAFGSQENPLATKIKGRGNYTFTGFEKKPYRLKLDKKAALCGMKSSKHWGLLAHADDNRGFLRNALGFKTSELVGLPWTPKQYPVELVVNGTYRGLYFLTQIIRIDSDRVNITKWGEEDENGVALDKWIEGGTLVELDNYEEPAQIQFYNPGSPEPLRFTYDKSVDPGFEPDGYLDWLKQSLGKVNNLIINGSRTSDELWQYVDIDDLARFITVQEFMDNYESFHGSCYLYREKGDNEKWHFSPVWDFGSAFQRSHPDHSCFLMQSGNMHYNHWVLQLLEFPALREKIAQYWAILKEQRPAIEQYADQFIAQITSAAANDRERWPQYGNDNLTGKLNEVKGFMNSSSNYMNHTFNGQQVDEVPFYLCGRFNAWTLADSSYKFTQSGNVYTYVVTKDIPVEEDYGWKINNGTWDINFGPYNDNIKLNEEFELLADHMINFTVELKAGYKLIFTYNKDGVSTLKIATADTPNPPTPPTPEPDIDFYLSGEFNGWASRDESYKFTYEADRNRFTYVVKEPIQGKKWKIKDETDSWDVNFGANGSVELKYNQPYTGVHGGTNFTTSIPAGSRFVLVYNPDNGSCVFTIQTEWSTDEYSKSVRFIDAHPDRWEQVYAQVWNADNTNEVYTEQWPGTPMTRSLTPQTLAADAISPNVWTLDINPEKYVRNIKMKFSNGNEGDDNNTPERDYAESYTREDMVTVIETAADTEGYTISSENGAVIIRSEKYFTLTVSDLNGRYMNYEIVPGITVINLGQGIYIVDGHKIHL